MSAVRRGISSSSASSKNKNTARPTKMNKEEIPLSESLGPPLTSATLDGADSDEENYNNNNNGNSSGARGTLNIEQRYEQERQASKVKHWRDNSHCAGLVEPTWQDELNHSNPCCGCCPNVDLDGSDEIEAGACGCVYISAFVCSKLGAGRVGNMAILKQSQEWVEEIQEDEETGQDTKRRFTRPRFDCIVGPFWPMLVCVTYPLIIGVSFWTLVTSIPGKSFLLQAFWALCTGGLLLSLTLVSCRDPGILPKYSQSPPQDDGSWRWNDQAQSYRPRGAMYDTDTAVIIEEFDHTCPWTGTAIGKKNLAAFRSFICCLAVLTMLNAMLMALKAADGTAAKKTS